MSIAPGMTSDRHQRQPPVQRQQHADGDEQPDERDGRRDDRHLQQAGRRVHVAGQARQDAAGLHVPQLRQRQVQQPVEERAPQRQHHLRVEQALPVVAHDADERRQQDHRRGTSCPARLRRVRRAAVSSAVFSRTRSMMYRMNSGSIIWRPVPISASPKSVADAVAMRPEPAQVLAEILAPLAAEQLGLLVLALAVLRLCALARSTSCRWLRPYGRRAAGRGSRARSGW